MLDPNIWTTCVQGRIQKVGMSNEDVEKQDLKELFENNEIARLMVKLLLWLEASLLYQGHSFLEFHVMYFLSSHFYIKFSEISCDYKFCVFLNQDIWIQQLLCFHICQSRIMNKLDNFVLEFFTLSTLFSLEFNKFFTVSF